ncbi:hypothetical protein NMS_0334 [Nonlabens marinus S1-08]|uniref:Uncharacterized protein n=1 Tax=Nonlabens marinus S1-08 TaxID=1454201 RepID=W8VU69_9FLAO|nr:hypothetical protein NMS_0334 [Nonlabens marinus S1-08]
MDRQQYFKNREKDCFEFAFAKANSTKNTRNYSSSYYLNLKPILT